MGPGLRRSRVRGGVGDWREGPGEGPWAGLRWECEELQGGGGGQRVGSPACRGSLVHRCRAGTVGRCSGRCALIFLCTFQLVSGDPASGPAIPAHRGSGRLPRLSALPTGSAVVSLRAPVWAGPTRFCCLSSPPPEGGEWEARAQCATPKASPCDLARSVCAPGPGWGRGAGRQRGAERGPKRPHRCWGAAESGWSGTKASRPERPARDLQVLSWEGAPLRAVSTGVRRCVWP